MIRRDMQSTPVGSGTRIVKRREFIAIIGSAGVWPFVALAQEPVPVVGFLNNATPEAYAPFVTAFKGLAQAGYIDGQNVAIEYRWGHFAANQLSVLANELVQRKASVLVASGGDQIIQAARAVTTTVPMVVLVGNDPVETGFPVLQWCDPTFGGTSGTLIRSGDFPTARICSRWRPDELRQQLKRGVSTGRHLHWPRPKSR